MDPFMGSGTTIFAAENLLRNSIGIEILKDYYNKVKKEIRIKELYLFEKEPEYVTVANK
jgi:site-specific DNA-methyltransferase (adenine-specific)/site-specific DNA-methyltransferase (cytosine-N4-specific)